MTAGETTGQGSRSDIGERSPAFANDKSLRRNRAATLAVRRDTWIRSPTLWDEVARTAQRGIVIVPGAYDLPSLIVRELGLPYRVVPPRMLSAEILDDAALVVLGCPGPPSDNGSISALESFTRQGGVILATGHAGSAAERLTEGRSMLTEVLRGTSRQQVTARLPELGHPAFEGEWEAHPGGRATYLGSAGPEEVTIPLLAAQSSRPKLSYPIASWVGVGAGGIVAVASHLLETRPAPDRNGHPASSDPRWSQITQEAPEAGQLLGGLTSESLDRAARAVNFFVWVMGRCRDLPSIVEGASPE